MLSIVESPSLWYFMWLSTKDKLPIEWSLNCYLLKIVIYLSIELEEFPIVSFVDSYLYLCLYCYLL